MSAPERNAAARAVGAPRLSRRAERSAPRTPSSCWPRSTRSLRQGRDIMSFCIGQPDFPTPRNIQDGGDHGDPDGKHGYTPSAGIDELRAAAAQTSGRARGLEIRPEDVVVGAGAKPFIAYTDRSPSPTTAPATRSSTRSRASRSTSRRSTRNGAVPVPLYLREARDFAFDPAELEAKITPQTQAADPQLAAQPDRRHPAPARSRRHRRDPAPAPAGLGVRRRDLLAACVRRRVRVARVAARACTSARSSPMARRRPGR